MPAASYLQGLSWYGHSSFKVARGGVTLYLDPWRLPVEPHDADLVLITHPHFDHLDPGDVAKVVKSDTVIVTVADCAAKLQEAKVPGTIQIVKPGDVVKVKGAVIEVVPAYNTNKPAHPKEKQWVGFIVEIDGVRIYHAGDTDFIPEMRGFKNLDVALLPISGTYTMTVEEAVEAAQALSPKVVVPMHYGQIIGTAEDAKRFQKLCNGMLVEILPREKGKK